MNASDRTPRICSPDVPGHEIFNDPAAAVERLTPA